MEDGTSRHIDQPILRMAQTARRLDWEWILWVARLEYGRACVALSHWSSERHTLLRMAAEKPGLEPHTYSFICELHSLAEAQLSSGAWRDAVETLQRILDIIGECDGYTLACVQVVLAAVEVASDLLPQAERRLLRALPVLRQLGDGDGRAAEAVLLLLAMVRPRRRVRGRAHAEDVLLDTPGTPVLDAWRVMPTNVARSSDSHG